MKVAFFALVILIGLAVASCADATADTAPAPEACSCHCELVESAPVWSANSKCPRAKGWFMKGLGQSAQGVFQAECVKIEQKCSCPAEEK